MVYRQLLRWEGLGKSPKFNILHFDSTATNTADMQTGLALWLEALKGRWCETFSVTILGEVVQLNDATGQLEAVIGGSDSAPIEGTNTSPVSADATQVLMRWGTAMVVNGRRLSGRTFFPGVPQPSVVDGNLSSAAKTIWDNETAIYLGTDPGLAVWHRPTASAPTGGVVAPVTNGVAWSELAVQRGRRG